MFLGENEEMGEHQAFTEEKHLNWGSLLLGLENWGHFPWASWRQAAHPPQSGLKSIAWFGPGSVPQVSVMQKWSINYVSVAKEERQ